MLSKKISLYIVVSLRLFSCLFKSKRKSSEKRKVNKHLNFNLQRARKLALIEFSDEKILNAFFLQTQQELDVNVIKLPRHFYLLSAWDKILVEALEREKFTLPQTFSLKNPFHHFKLNMMIKWNEMSLARGGKLNFWYYFKKRT